VKCGGDRGKARASRLDGHGRHDSRWRDLRWLFNACFEDAEVGLSGSSGCLYGDGEIRGLRLEYWRINLWSEFLEIWMVNLTDLVRVHWNWNWRQHISIGNSQDCSWNCVDSALGFCSKILSGYRIWRKLCETGRIVPIYFGMFFDSSRTLSICGLTLHQSRSFRSVVRFEEKSMWVSWFYGKFPAR